MAASGGVRAARPPRPRAARPPPHAPPPRQRPHGYPGPAPVGAGAGAAVRCGGGPGGGGGGAPPPPGATLDRLVVPARSVRTKGCQMEFLSVIGLTLAVIMMGLKLFGS